ANEHVEAARGGQHAAATGSEGERALVVACDVRVAGAVERDAGALGGVEVRRGKVPRPDVLSTWAELQEEGVLEPSRRQVGHAGPRVEVDGRRERPRNVDVAGRVGRDRVALIDVGPPDRLGPDERAGGAELLDEDVARGGVREGERPRARV